MKKTISRFRQIAYSGTFRNDGQLLAAGSEEGVVKVGVVKFVPQCLECLYLFRYLIQTVVLYSDSARDTQSTRVEIAAACAHF